MSHLAVVCNCSLFRSDWWPVGLTNRRTNHVVTGIKYMPWMYTTHVQRFLPGISDTYRWEIFSEHFTSLQSGLVVEKRWILAIGTRPYATNVCCWSGRSQRHVGRIAGKPMESRLNGRRVVVLKINARNSIKFAYLCTLLIQTSGCQKEKEFS